MLRQLHFPPLLSGTGAPNVDESGRGTSTLLLQLLEAVSSDVALEAVLDMSTLYALSYDLSLDFGLDGRGSCSARKPEAKHPPYAFKTSNDAALLKAMVSLWLSTFPSSDSAKSPSYR